MNSLSIQVLGSPTVWVADEIIPIKQRKVLALLIYLAVTMQPQQRDNLAALFWPELNQKRAQANLRNTLWVLRKTVGENWLIVEENAVQLAYAPKLDLAEFNTLIKSLKSFQNPTSSISILEEAVALYRGDFLSGFTLTDSPGFDDWQLFETETARLSLADALDFLVKHYIKFRKYEAAISHARRRLALDQLHEPAHQALIRVYALSGQNSAALKQGETCRKILADSFGVEPDAETRALIESIQNRTFVSEEPEVPLDAQLFSSSEKGSLRHDWGDSFEVANFYGRESEQAILTEWLATEQCKIAVVLGMGGIGKTTLTTRIAHQIIDNFEYIIWRSLRNAPPLTEILADCIRLFSDQKIFHLPDGDEGDIQLLLEYLQQKRCLIILDNMEAIMRDSEEADFFRQGYENFDYFFRRIGESQHKSSLVLTSRERPKAISLLEKTTASVKTLYLSPLGLPAGRKILENIGLTGSAEEWEKLIASYSGNPLALKLIAETIKEIFEGDISAFLDEGVIIFGSVKQLLDDQFERLSALEKSVMVWLAIAREPASLDYLSKSLIPATSKRMILETLVSLKHHSLIEWGKNGFTLQNVVMEYMTEHLIDTVCQEINLDLSPAIPSPSWWFNKYPLIEAQAKYYVRVSQTRLILQPVADRLLEQKGQFDREKYFKELLNSLRLESVKQGYAAGNILNLLLHQGCDLKGWDFSDLAIWQAFLQGYSLQDVDFSRANLMGIHFSQTFDHMFCVAFSPDGSKIASGGADQLVRIWDARTGQELGQLRGHTTTVWSVDFSPDGDRIVTASEDKTIRTWDISNIAASGDGNELQLMQGHTDTVRSVVFTLDGRKIISGSYDKTIRIWDTDSGREMHVLKNNTGRILSIALSPDNSQIISGGDGAFIHIWSTENGQKIGKLQSPFDNITTIAISPDGSKVALGSWERVISIWDIHDIQSTGRAKELVKLVGHSSAIHAMVFSPDGHQLVSSSEDATIRIWDVHSGQELLQLHGHAAGTISSVDISPDGRHIVSCSTDMTIRLWKTALLKPSGGGQEIWRLQGHSNGIPSLALSPDNQKIVSAGLDGVVRIWATYDGQELYQLRGHSQEVQSVAFNPDGSRVVSGGADRSVRIWDVNSGRELRQLRGHTQGIGSVAFSSDGKHIVSGSHDATVRLWDAYSGQELLQIRHDNSVRFAGFSPEGSIVSGCWDHLIHFWDVRTGQKLLQLGGHTSGICHVVFKPDGSQLVSSSWDRTMRVWDAKSGLEIGQLRGNRDRSNGMAFSPDGSLFAAADADKHIHIWDAESWAELGHLKGHTHEVWSVAFGATGKILISGSFDQTIKFWDVTAINKAEDGKCIATLRADRPYERMNILQVTGLTEGQKATLKDLGAIEGYSWENPETTPPETDQRLKDLISGFFPKTIKISYEGDPRS